MILAKKKLFLIIAVACFHGVTAFGSLVNDTVESSVSFRSYTSVPERAVVVDPGVEFVLQLTSDRIKVFEVDLGESTVDFEVLKTVSSIGGLGPYTLSDMDWVGTAEEISGLDFTSDIDGMNAGRISFTHDSVSVDFDGLNLRIGQSLNIELETEQSVETVLGDFTGNGMRDTGDLDALAIGMIANDLSFDINEDGTTNVEDRRIWVEELANTYFGDVNFDGEFSSADFTHAFTSTRYESGNAAIWTEGDWNGDQLFNSADFVLAFARNGYQSGPRPGGLRTVPEPTAALLLLIGAINLRVFKCTKHAS